MEIAKRYTSEEVTRRASDAYTATHTGAVYHRTPRGKPVQRVTKIGRANRKQ